MKLLSSVVPYLLLVSFYTGTLQNFGNDKAGMVNMSPYQGVAATLLGAYDTGTITTGSFTTAITRLKGSSEKHIWPWIFFNRFYGYDPKEKALSPAANKDYFLRIKGMDIYDQTGALKDFYNIWTVALTTAKELRTPGIFVDMEAYNNYKLYNLSYLSQKLGRDVEEVKGRLKAVGAELVDIADRVYPDAELWFAFTGLGTPSAASVISQEKEFMTVTYIVQGMLERAKINKSKLKVISGGTLSLGYCYKSLSDLKDRIAARNENHATPLKEYSNYSLGGTIALWHDAALKKQGFFTQGKCGQNNLNNLDDFKPLISALLSSYNHIFIYAAMDVGYNPYDPSLAGQYNAVMKDVVSKEGRKPKAPRLYIK